MSYAEVIQKLAGARFDRHFYQDNVWRPLCMDWSSDFPDYGNTVNIPIDATTYSEDDISTTFTPDQTTLTNLQWGDPDLTTADGEDLVCNQYFKMNQLVTDVQRAYVRPNILETVMMNQARIKQENMNKYIRDSVFTATAVGTDQTLTTIVTTAANFGNSAMATKVAETLKNAQLKADGLYWPETRVVVVSPNVYQMMVDYFESKNWFVSSNINDRAVQDGSVIRYRGWTIMKDNSTGTGTAATDDDKHTLRFLIPGETLHFAERTNRFRVIDSETYMGFLVQGNWNYGAKIIQGKKGMVCPVQIDA